MEARRIRLQGERGISRKTIAQGMPECSGCTCMLVCASISILHTRPRVQQAPGIPCTLRFRGRGQVHANLGRNASRECERTFSCRHPRRRVIQYSRDAMIEPIGRGVLDTRLRGYDDLVLRYPPVIASASEAIHLSVREETMDCFASLAMTWRGRGAPDTPACVGYDEPLAPRKILQTGSAIGVSPTPVTPM